MRVAPGQAVTFFFYERIKKWLQSPRGSGLSGDKYEE
jgi:hypothetical protein